MQKKLIALAVAALASSGAMAQVTFYGVFDAGIARVSGERTTGDDQKFNGINSGNLSGNRLGFTAEEDLGDGLKAIGRFEMGSLSLDAGSGGANGIDSTRQSFVGLSSGAGTLVLGRLQTPGYDAGIKHDALAGGSVFSPFGAMANSAAGAQTITNGGTLGRVNNAIGYISPKLGGAVVKAAVARATSELSTATANGDAITVGVEFVQGPIEVSAVVARVDELGAATTDHNEAMIGFNYNLGVAKLMAEFISTSTDASGAETKGKFFQIGAVVPVGKGNIKVAYGTGDKDTANTDAAKMFGIDYEHAFGKRTTGYVGVSRVDVGDFTTTSIAGITASADKAITAFAAGLRLTF